MDCSANAKPAATSATQFLQTRTYLSHFLLVLCLGMLSACQTVQAPPPVEDRKGPQPSGGSAAVRAGAQLYVEGQAKPKPVDLNRFTFTGSGRLVLADGTVQEGSFVNGKLHGQGEWRLGSARYQGQWRNGARHGEGQQTYRNGDVYTGSWQADQRSGEGQLQRTDGSAYSGAWAADQRAGYGVATYTDHVRYTGMWDADKPHGFGLEERPDHTYYKGEWQQGRPHGEGEARLADGSLHSGQWQSGYILGHGSRADPLGTTIAGAFTRDVIAHGLVSFPNSSTYAGHLYGERGRSIAPGYLSWLQEAARTGDRYAQYYLAIAYLEFSKPLPETNAALGWLQASAASGLGHAQYRLAELLLDQDAPQALQWLVQAATQKHPAANRLLGQMYLRGHHVQQDINTAVRYLEAAIQALDIPAVHHLAWLHATTNTSWADPHSALELIQPLAAFAPDPERLEILAAAHARLQRYDMAQPLQQRALEGWRNLDPEQADPQVQDRIIEAEARLSLYTGQQPFVQPNG